MLPDCRIRLCRVSLVVCALAGWSGFVLAAEQWPAWRGPLANGYAPQARPPLKWSPTEHVRWKIPLPAPGNSTPIVWEQKIFLTQATESGRKRALWCIDRRDGKVLWQQTVDYPQKELTHPTNPYCSASPVTDGERVVVSHGSAGVFCYDFAGHELWRRELGPCRHIWGNAASPVIYNDRVLLNFGPGERTFLLAMDKKTGRDVWQVDEPGGKSGEKGRDEWLGSWSTPAIGRFPQGEQVLMSWSGVVKAYDPRDGSLLWSCRGLEKEKSPNWLSYTTPLATADTVVAMAGFGGAAMAVRPGGRGDVSDTHRSWRLPKSPQRIGSGVIIDGRIYMLNEPGTFECIELKSGKTVFLEKTGAGVWGSLVYAAGRLYGTNLDGETLVLDAQPKYRLLGRNPLGERTLASLALADAEVFLRTYQHLWCITEQ